jgi:hypothetical protein
MLWVGELHAEKVALLYALSQCINTPRSNNMLSLVPCTPAFHSQDRSSHRGRRHASVAAPTGRPGLPAVVYYSNSRLITHLFFCFALPVASGSHGASERTPLCHRALALAGGEAEKVEDAEGWDVTMGGCASLCPLRGTGMISVRTRLVQESHSRHLLALLVCLREYYSVVQYTHTASSPTALYVPCPW